MLPILREAIKKIQIQIIRRKLKPEFVFFAEKSNGKTQCSLIRIINFFEQRIGPEYFCKSRKIKAKRTAKTGNIAEEKVLNLTKQNAVAPFFGCLVTEKISVSELNIALDKLK